MSQTKLLKFKTYPSNWLYRAYFKFEEKFIYPKLIILLPKKILSYQAYKNKILQFHKDYSLELNY